MGMYDVFDQIKIGDKASNDDFGASVSARKISDPKKKKITKTVPFSNYTYDFTAINGEIFWEQRELEYQFEMIADTPERLEEMKIDFSNFVMNVIDGVIYDPFIPDYHFIGTYEDKSYDDDESGLKTTATVKFLAYPYKIANMPKVYKKTIPVGNNAQLVIPSEASHRITPTIQIEGDARIIYGNSSFAFSDTTVNDSTFSILPGPNGFYLENNGNDVCTVIISFYEEVF